MDFRRSHDLHPPAAPRLSYQQDYEQAAVAGRPMSITSDEAEYLTDKSMRSENITDRSMRSSEGSTWNHSDRAAGLADRKMSRGQSAPLSNSSQRSTRDRSNHDEALAVMNEGTADWILPEADIDICEREDGSEWLLGRGAFGKVYKALMGGFEPVALKVLQVDGDEPSLEAQARALRELKLLRDLRNPQSVQFLGGLLYRGQVAIVTELMPLGDLHTALKKHHVTWGPRALQIALDIALGLAFLHLKRIAHLDLKSPNVLLGRDYKAKIADVGIARVMVESEVSNVTSTGTFAWAAPELLLGLKVNELADIYSFGVVLWELVTGEQPRRGQLRSISVPDEAPAEVEAIITECLNSDPLQRPDARMLAQRLRAVSLHDPLSPASSEGLDRVHVQPARVALLSRNPSVSLPAPPPMSHQSYNMSRTPSRGESPEMQLPPPTRYDSPPSPESISDALHERQVVYNNAVQSSLPKLSPHPHSSFSRISSGDASTLRMDSMAFDCVSEVDSQDGEHRRVKLRLPPTGNAKLEQQLQELVQPGCTVREVSFAERMLGPDATIAIAVMLAHNTSLRRLDFRRNRPEMRGIQKLMLAVQRNRALVVLDLRDCQLGREGGMLVASMLQRNSTLGELSLWNTNLRQEGAVAILRALHSNNSLHRLDLGCNELGPEVGKEVAEMLKRNTSLEVLDMRNNRLAKTGITSIADGVQDNTSLRQLKLGNNATSMMFGMSSVKNIFKSKQQSSGLTVSLQ